MLENKGTERKKGIVDQKEELSNPYSGINNQEELTELSKPREGKFLAKSVTYKLNNIHQLNQQFPLLKK